jgi:hypothetical protein
MVRVARSLILATARNRGASKACIAETQRGRLTKNRPNDAENRPQAHPGKSNGTPAALRDRWAVDSRDTQPIPAQVKSDSFFIKGDEAGCDASSGRPGSGPVVPSGRVRSTAAGISNSTAASARKV